MVDKAPLGRMLCTGAPIVLIPMLVVFHSDSVEQQPGIEYHCMHDVEKLLETHHDMHLVEKCSVTSRCSDATGTGRVSAAPSSSQFLGGPDTTLARKASSLAATERTGL